MLVSPLLGIRRQKRPSSADYPKNNERHQVKKKNSDLINRHPNIVDGVELLVRQAKPLAMEATHPVTGDDKHQKPQEQYSVVDNRAPQKKAAHEFNAHLLSSSLSISFRDKKEKILISLGNFRLIKAN
jgi:hypothetical protein